MVILGPGFLQEYLRSSEINKYCAIARFRASISPLPKGMVLEGRVLLDKARLLPLVHPEFEAILRKYRRGTIRIATDKERSLFYALIDFEIDYPVYVIDSDEGRLLVYLQAGTRIHWLEYLNLWNLGGLDQSTLVFLKERFAVSHRNRPPSEGWDGWPPEAGRPVQRVLPVDIPLPQPSADPGRAHELNRKYQEEVARWKALQWWKRRIVKKPEPPRGI